MFFFNLFKKKTKWTPKLGLALGSGGAKGFAHIGALKAFEENDLEFDVIGGTSIGSIVGAFYAQGYTSTDVLQLLKSIDFNEVKKLIMIRMDTGAVQSVLEKALGDLVIEELKKPFVAVATDLASGKEYDFYTGSVAKALCASSAYPPFFKPVKVDGKLLIDGAFVNSVPANLVKGLGADYVVGIDIGAYNKKEKTSFLSEIFPNANVVRGNSSLLGYQFSDVMLRPNLAEFKPTMITRASEMYEIGYQEALAQIPKIKEDIEKLKANHKKK